VSEFQCFSLQVSIFEYNIILNYLDFSFHPNMLYKLKCDKALKSVHVIVSDCTNRSLSIIVKEFRIGRQEILLFRTFFLCILF
jgi:hypothetical protein